jgi:SAM-dependent MidA family methyltransferase
LDKAWIEQWWPGASGIVEIGRSRDEAWASVVAKLSAGVALTVDYGHFLGTRPSLPTLTGFRDGREVQPLLDGSTDITCHVAIDSVAAAPGLQTRVLSQRDALHWLGISGARPRLELAHRDPAAYVQALAEASEAGTLTDPNGLGGHWWVLHTLGCEL